VRPASLQARRPERCLDLDDDGDDAHCKIAIQTNNLEVDDRGYVYAADRANTGMHILDVTGEAKRIARQPVEPNPDTGNPLPEGGVAQEDELCAIEES
jgi:hypothetical protein